MVRSFVALGEVLYHMGARYECALTNSWIDKNPLCGILKVLRCIKEGFRQGLG
jgi:hypothetical protein